MTRAKLACPDCGHPVSKVVRSKPMQRRDGVYRMRQCKKCGARFTTEEVISPVVPSGARVK